MRPRLPTPAHQPRAEQPGPRSTATVRAHRPPADASGTTGTVTSTHRLGHQGPLAPVPRRKHRFAAHDHRQRPRAGDLTVPLRGCPDAHWAGCVPAAATSRRPTSAGPDHSRGSFPAGLAPSRGVWRYRFLAGMGLPRVRRCRAATSTRAKDVLPPCRAECTWSPVMLNAEGFSFSTFWHRQALDSRIFRRSASR